MTVFEYIKEFFVQTLFGTDFFATDFGNWLCIVGAAVCTLLVVFGVVKFFAALIKCIFRIW